MLEQIIATGGVILLVVVGLLVANVLTDRGVDVYVSRRVPATLGGSAYLIAVLWLDVEVAIALSAFLTVGVIAIRVWLPRGVRGLQASLPTQPWVEITYALSGTASLAIGWGLLGERWLAFLPIGFMAWGDTASAIVTYLIVKRRGRLSLWPQSAMVVICLAVAALLQPYWIGAVGAVAATVAERLTPRVFGIQDDNWTIVGASLAVMALLKTGMG